MTVLCGASSYEQKYYFNKDFDKLPQQIKDELQIMCVSFTEEAGGVLLVQFDDNGDLSLKVEVDDHDYLFDDIESGIQIGRIQREKEELFRNLETYYKVFVLKQISEADLLAAAEAEGILSSSSVTDEDDEDDSWDPNEEDDEDDSRDPNEEDDEDDSRDSDEEDDEDDKRDPEND